MAAGTFTLYNGVAEWIADGTIDLDNDTFNITLHSSAYTPLATHDVYADLSGELTTAAGYTNGGAALTGVTWTRSGGTAKFDSNDQVWTAPQGQSLTARYAVVRDVTANKLIGYMLLDTTPADVTATGGTLTVGPHASNGWFQLTVNA